MLQTSVLWLAELYPEMTILDPDGWDRTNYEYSFYEEEITEEEFVNRLQQSTVIFK